nr:hypothetical protein [Tanacetum cinerariifolium]
MMGYFFCYPPENKVLVARNAEFFENSLITQEENGSLEDLEIIQNEDTYPFENTSLHHDEDDQEISEPQIFETFKVFQKEVENQLGKTIKLLRFDREGEYMSQKYLDHLKEHGVISHRIPPYTPQHNSVFERRNRTLLDMVRSMMSQNTLPKSFYDYALEPATHSHMVLTKKIEKTPYGEHELGDLNEPAKYKDALLDPESDKWLATMNVEMQSMKDNQVWDLVDLSPNGKTVGSKWLFKKKTNMDGNVHTYKARLVAKGFTQTYMVNYEETFYYVVDIRSIRIIIAIDAFYDYEI